MLSFLSILVGSLSCMRLALASAIALPQTPNPQSILGFGNLICSDSADFACGALETAAPLGFNAWLQNQRKLSFGYLLDNVAPNGSNAKGAVAGTVLASPSKQAPNYYYQWVRDAAITMHDVVQEYGKTGDPKLKAVIDYYADLQGVLQNTFNPSGGYTTGGLGEPKFQVDGAPFTGNWGRPQRDGPALRALTLINYIRTVNATSTITKDLPWIAKLYDGRQPTQSVIKADLEYVSNSWNLTSFDLWEEINDMHFYTAIVQHKSLVDGRDLAAALGDPGASAWYEIQQIKLADFIKKNFWDSTRGHLKSMLNTPSRNGLDCALLLGALHGGSNSLFPPWSDEVLASMEKLIRDMASRHPINQQPLPYCPANFRHGVGIGRYPEDIYDGVGFGEGNPWFLCTSSVSNVLYKVISHYITKGRFDINETNKGFFNWLSDEKAVVGSYTTTHLEFQEYLISMFKFADSFMNVIRWHTTNEGRLSEQFNKYNGLQQGAHDLTWSYGSFISASNDREPAKQALSRIVEAC